MDTAYCVDCPELTPAVAERLNGLAEPGTVLDDDLVEIVELVCYEHAIE